MVKNSQVINSIHRVINSYAQVSHNRNHRNFLKGERAPMTVFSAESFDVAVIGAGHALSLIHILILFYNSIFYPQVQCVDVDNCPAACRAAV